MVTRIKSEGTLQAAILALERARGLTHEGMARALGAPLRTYQRWLAGSTAPSAKYLTGLLALCLNEECREMFSGKAAPAPLPDPYDQLRADLEIVIRSGQSQLIGQAEEVLNRLADNARHMTVKQRGKKR